MRPASVRPPMRAPTGLNTDPVMGARLGLARPPVPGPGRRSLPIVGYDKSSRPKVRSATCSSVGRIRGWGGTHSPAAKTAMSTVNRSGTGAAQGRSVARWRTTGRGQDGIAAGSGSTQTVLWMSGAGRRPSAQAGSALRSDRMPTKTWPETPASSGPARLELSHRGRASIRVTATITPTGPNRRGRYRGPAGCAVPKPRERATMTSRRARCRSSCLVRRRCHGRRRWKRRAARSSQHGQAGRSASPDLSSHRQQHSPCRSSRRLMRRRYRRNRGRCPRPLRPSSTRSRIST